MILSPAPISTGVFCALGDLTEELPPMEENLVNAHKHFRSVLACATLVATINGGGQSQLVLEDQGEENKLRSLLSLVPAVLVRDIEVIAAVAHGPHPHKSASDAASGSLRVNIVQNAPLLDPSAQDKPEAFPTPITAVANPYVADPRKGDPYFAKEVTGPDCLIVTSGQSHLPFIGDITEWERYILEIPNDDPLENHVATFSDFIKLARVYKQSGDESYEHLLERFSPYLVTRCWKKMRRRISHWAAQGFIYHLGRVDESRLRAVVPQTASSLENDSNLSDKLLEMEGDIQDVVMKTCPDPSVRSPLTSLLSACRTMPMVPRQEGPASLRGVSALYNKATCFEFHQLLVATLLSYGKALDKFAAALQDHRKGPNFPNLLQRTDEIWTCASLLWSIAYSRILENHLEILWKNGWLAAPINRDYHTYSGFTHFERTKEQVITTVDDDERGGNEGQEIKILSTSSHLSDSAEEDEEWDGGRTGKDGEGGHEDEEIDALGKDHTPVGLADVYHRWIRLQVDRWQATRKIVSRLARSPAPVNFTFFAIRHVPPRLATSVMNPWSNTINDLCNTAGIDPGPVIVALNDRINKEASQIRCNAIFTKFSSKEALYSAGVHCEAVLASLLKYPGGGGDELRKHFEDSDDNKVIAVSKPCCLVCWHLLKVLRGNSEDFHVRGHHKNLYQVELPQWLPREVVVEVTAEFEKILLHQIIIMQRRSKHAPTHSVDSKGGISPDSSDGEEDSVALQRTRRRRSFHIHARRDLK